MNALGRHFLVEIKDCNPEILKNIRKIKNALVSSAKKTGATVIKSFFTNLAPLG